MNENDKDYTILVSYEEHGEVTVTATSPSHAECLVIKAMESNGLTDLDFKCTNREYNTHGELT